MVTRKTVSCAQDYEAPIGEGDESGRSFGSFGRQKFSCGDFTFIKVLGKGSFGKVRKLVFIVIMCNTTGS